MKGLFKLLGQTAGLLILGLTFGVAAQAQQCVVKDDFNRADSTNMGANWTETAGDFSISGNRAVGISNSEMLYNGNTTGDAACVDVYSGGNALKVARVLLKYTSPSDHLRVLLQDSEGDGLFDRIYFDREGFVFNQACATSLLTTPITSGRLTAYLDGTTLKGDIDTNFDGTIDQSYQCTNAPQKSGTKVVLSNFGPVQFDNFATVSQTLTVTKTADTNDGVCDADCSLREAIAAAQSGDTITFASPLFDTAQTITLTLGELSVSGKTLTINGTGANRLAISGNNASRVFNMGSGANLTLNDLTVTGGRLTGSNNNGSGILNNGGTLTLTNCAVTNNSVIGGISNSGGGIYSFGTLTLTNSTISNNSLIGGTNSLNQGGGINSAFSTVNITNSTISNNSASGGVGNDGGGIYAFDGTLNITGSTISNNSVSGGSTENYGGGVYLRQGTHNFSSSTVSGNFVSGSGSNEAGGIALVQLTLNLTGSTITNNSVIGGSTNRSGGIGSLSSSTINARNSIISGNTAASSPDSANSLSAASQNNLVGNATQVRLAPLGFYGGATMTHALLSGSTAINAGNNCVLTQTCATFNAPVALTSDQRSASRVGQVDIGAFEVNNSANGGTFRATLPGGVQNVAYNYTVIPEADSTSYCISAGSLPNGLSGIPACLPPLADGDSSTKSELVPSAAVALSGTPTQSGTFNFSVTASNGGNTNVTDYTLNIMAPTAAGVMVSGRVLVGKGSGLTKAIVTMTDINGNIRSFRTTSFGYFQFDDVEVGQTYVLRVNSKRFQFTPQIVTIHDDLTEVIFVAQE